MATVYIRFQKKQKYYLGQPVDPPEYQKGELVSSDLFLDLDECENEYKWVSIGEVGCFDENDDNITVLPKKIYKPLYLSKSSPVSVMDTEAGDRVYATNSDEIIIVKSNETYDNGTFPQ